MLVVLTAMHTSNHQLNCIMQSMGSMIMRRIPGNSYRRRKLLSSNEESVALFSRRTTHSDSHSKTARYNYNYKYITFICLIDPFCHEYSCCYYIYIAGAMRNTENGMMCGEVDVMIIFFIWANYYFFFFSSILLYNIELELVFNYQMYFVTTIAMHGY